MSHHLKWSVQHNTTKPLVAWLKVSVVTCMDSTFWSGCSNPWMALVIFSFSTGPSMSCSSRAAIYKMRDEMRHWPSIQIHKWAIGCLQWLIRPFFSTEWSKLVFCLSFTHETLSLCRIIVLHLEAVTTFTLFPASTDSKIGTILWLFIGKHGLSNIAN